MRLKYLKDLSRLMIKDLFNLNSLLNEPYSIDQHRGFLKCKCRAYCCLCMVVTINSINFNKNLVDLTKHN